MDYFHGYTFPLGETGFIKQMTSLALTRKFHTDWLGIPLPGEAEMAIRLIIKFWFGAVLWCPFGLLIVFKAIPLIP